MNYMKDNPLLKKAFFSSIIIFVLLLSYFFLPFFDGLKKTMFPFITILGFLFLVLGVLMTYYSTKQKSSKFKKFLTITGISSIMPFLFAILHNIFYNFAELFSSLKGFFEVLHVGSFLIAMIIAPLLYIIGAIGCLIYWPKK